MTKHEALVKARKLWGNKANVATRPKGEWSARYYGRCNINSGTWACNDGKGLVNIYGNGRTWEAAFEDAKRRYKYWERNGSRPPGAIVPIIGR
jgi:hypothetical protein